MVMTISKDKINLSSLVFLSSSVSSEADASLAEDFVGHFCKPAARGSCLLRSHNPDSWPLIHKLDMVLINLYGR